MNIESIRDYVIVKTDTLLKEDVQTQNIGLKLIASYNKQENAMDHAEVIQVPWILSNKLMFGITRNSEGLPQYGPRKTPETNQWNPEERDKYFKYVDNIYSRFIPKYYKLSDIPMNIKKGDKIYFHYNCLLNPENLLHQEMKKVNGDIEYEFVFKIKYDDIICRVRKGKITCVSGNILVRPDMESMDDILVPTYYSPEVTGGKKIERPKEEWIQTKVCPEERPIYGFVEHVCPPMKGDDMELSVGDKIIFKPVMKGKYRINVEGKDYFPVKYQQVLGKFC